LARDSELAGHPTLQFRLGGVVPGWWPCGQLTAKSSLIGFFGGPIASYFPHPQPMPRSSGPLSATGNLERTKIAKVTAAGSASLGKMRRSLHKN
jgi:hypothetical protein